MEIKYIKGVQNIVADVLSRYPTGNDPTISPTPTENEQQCKLFATDNALLADDFPLSLRINSTFQQRKAALNNLISKNKRYSRKLFMEENN